jgi:hypothetical protein
MTDDGFEQLDAALNKETAVLYDRMIEALRETTAGANMFVMLLAMWRLFAAMAMLYADKDKDKAVQQLHDMWLPNIERIIKTGSARRAS